MKLITTQVALFSKDLISRPDKMKDEIEQKMGGSIFDAMPLILNLPVDAPSDLPIVQAKSVSGRYALNISRMRIDYIVNPDYESNDDPLTAFNTYRSSVERFCKAVTSQTEISRIGIVFTLFENNADSVRAIYDRYLKTNCNAKCIEVTVRFNVQKQVKGLLLNNIRVIEAGNLHIDRNGTGEDKKGVIIQLDTNNVPSIQNKLTNDNIATVIMSAIKNLDPNEIREMV